MTRVKEHYRKTAKGRRTKVRAHNRKDEPKLPKREMVDIVGDQIDRNYKTHIETNWEHIQSELKELPKYDEDEDLPNAYFTVRKLDKYVEFDGIMFSDYYRGAGGDYWVIPVMVDRTTTKKELLDVDASEESHFYDDL